MKTRTLEPQTPRAETPTSSPPTVATTHRRGRPTAERASNLRDDILNAALRLFLAHGFEAASMESIARDAGVARVTLYRQFESKEQMFVEVARRAQLRVRDRFGSMEDRGAPLEQVLREIIEKLYDGFTQPEYLAVMRLVVAEANRFPKLGRAMLNDSKFVAQPLVDYLTALKASGQIDIESPEDAATQICGMASGAGRYVLVKPSRLPASRRHWVESLVQLFTRAWSVPAKR